MARKHKATLKAAKSKQGTGDIDDAICEEARFAILTWTERLKFFGQSGPSWRESCSGGQDGHSRLVVESSRGRLRKAKVVSSASDF